MVTLIVQVDFEDQEARALQGPDVVAEVSFKTVPFATAMAALSHKIVSWFVEAGR